MAAAALFIGTAATAQYKYEFTVVKENPATPVKNQAKTGTCWCFSTNSFIESELIRMGKGEHDLSEMFIVRQNYMKRIADNYLRLGKGNINPGSSHICTSMQWLSMDLCLMRFTMESTMIHQHITTTI
jgi:bleomycin hydrolase